MTLEQLQYNIGQIALKNNLVNEYFAGGSLFELNAEVINEYPLIFITPAGDHTVKENTTRYSLTIYYVDRLWDDDRNETDVCSAGIETLKNIKRQLPYLDWVAYVQEEPIIRLFTETEKMNDRVAGAYMNLWVEVINASTCPEFLDELGRPMGNYIPGNINVLDAYATKAWVILQRYATMPWVLEQIANIQLSGGTTAKQVQEMIASALTEYTKTERFATINGSAITEGGNLELVTKDIYDAFTALTQSGMTTLSALTTQVLGNMDVVLDFDEVSTMTVEERTSLYSTLRAMDPDRRIWFLVRKPDNTETQFVLIFGRKSNYIDFVGYYNVGLYTAIYFYEDGSLEKRDMPVYSLPTASASVKGGIKVGSGLTMSGDTLYAEPSVSSSITQDITTLSAYTVESVSSLTTDLTALSAVTELTASGLSVLSAVTVDLLGKQAIVLDWGVITALTTEEKIALYNELTATPLTKEIWIMDRTGSYGSETRTFFFPIAKRYGSYLHFEGFKEGNKRNIFYIRGTGQYSRYEYDIYGLPTASNSTKGGVKVGSGLTMTSEVLSTQYQVWVGTQAQYEALQTYDNMTFYVITGLN